MTCLETIPIIIEALAILGKILKELWDSPLGHKIRKKAGGNAPEII